MKTIKVKPEDIGHMAHCTECHRSYRIPEKSCCYKGPCNNCGRRGFFVSYNGVDKYVAGSYNNAFKKSRTHITNSVCDWWCKRPATTTAGIDKIKYEVVTLLVAKRKKYVIAIGKEKWFVIQSHTMKDFMETVADYIAGHIGLALESGDNPFAHETKTPKEEITRIRKEYKNAKEIQIPVVYPIWTKDKMKQFNQYRKDDRKNRVKLVAQDWKHD